MSHRRYGSAQPTVFNVLHANRGLESFKSALEASPDVLGYLRSLNRTNSRDDFNFRDSSRSPDLRAAVPPSKTGHSYGIHTRFPSKPEAGSGLSVSLPVTEHVSGLRFQSRKETYAITSPGPEAYVIPINEKPVLGVMSREQKFKEHQESYQSLLGPGSYEVKTDARGSSGYQFAKSVTQVQEVEVVPGPGHYPHHHISHSVSFSIPKTEDPLISESVKLGPGYYGIPDPYKRAPACKFDFASRFHESHESSVQSTPHSGYRPRYKRMTEDEKKAQRQRLQSNKDLTHATPEAKLQRIVESNQRQVFKRAVARMVKVNLQASVTQRRKTALEDKFRKFEMRMNKDLMRNVQRKWVAVVTYAAVLGMWHRKFERRKELHIRSEAHLKFLTLTCLCLGVVLRKRLAMRKRRALSVLRRIAPYASRWLLRHRQSMRENITSFVERTMMKDVIYQLMRRWVRNLLMVQRAVRRFVAERKLLYAMLKQTWNLIEAEIHKSVIKTRGPANETVYESISSIPDVVKEYYLRFGLQRKFGLYYKEVVRYKEECARIAQAAEENRLELVTRAVLQGLNPEEIVVKMPPPPVCAVFLSRNDIKSLILDAETNRIHWDKIMQKSKHTRSSRSTAISSKTSL